MLLTRGGVSRCDANSGMDWPILDGILKLVGDRRGLKCLGVKLISGTDWEMLDVLIERLL